MYKALALGVEFGRACPFSSVHCRPNAEMKADGLVWWCVFFFFTVINSTGPAVRLEVLSFTGLVFMLRAERWD